MERKGELTIGYDGDVVLVDMEREFVVKDDMSWSRVGWNPFRGIGLVGWPVKTIVGGIPVFERTEETGQKGRLLVSAGQVGEPLQMGPWSKI
jgi:dihydroorotase